MRTIKWRCDTGYVGCDHEGEFEVEDDETDDAIDEMVEQEIYNYVTWSWWEEE